jgi:hypothetical protein
MNGLPGGTKSKTIGVIVLRNLSVVIAVGASLLLSAVADAAPAHKKRHVSRHWHGYGFLPGYRTPERIEWERARARGPQYWWGGPRYYRGRWNGGGFGPCWITTPIGPMWTCG